MWNVQIVARDEEMEDEKEWRKEMKENGLTVDGF